MGEVSFLLNGARVVLQDPSPTTTLLDWLRAEQGLTGTKEGCNEGDCGACTVAITARTPEGSQTRAVNACILFLPQLHGMALRTVEGIGTPDGKLHPVQSAMVEHHGSQCGFCTPGFVMSLFAAHQEGRQDFDTVLAGNLCRCTGYAPIIRAALAAAGAPCPAWSGDDAAALAGLDHGQDITLPGGFVPASLRSLADWYLANPDAVLVGGATDVGLWVTKGLRDLPKMCFLHRVSELRAVSRDVGGLRVGAGVTLADLRGLIAGAHPGFAELLRRYGSVQVRNSGTIGGNIANGSPIGDSPPALIALGASLTLRRGDARRTIALEDFFVDYGKQDRAQGEFVESILIPAQPDRLRCYKVSKRFDQDITAVLGCFSVTLAEGRVTGARIAFGGMAATPRRARAVEAALTGCDWTLQGIAPALDAFEQDFAPIDDMRASAAYRMQVARNLLRRAVIDDQGQEQTRLAGQGAMA